MKLFKINFETKIILFILFFSISIISFDRFQLYTNVTEQFMQSKNSKNELLINTISPILSLNISLGLHIANTEYLSAIIEQNPDLIYLDLVAQNGDLLFHYAVEGMDHQNIAPYSKAILDGLTDEKVATIEIFFSDIEFENMKKKNRHNTLLIVIFMLVLLFVFIMIIKREFKGLRELTKKVLSYNPKENTLVIEKKEQNDEISVINNAISTMLERINSHAELLDELNKNLELKVKSRTQELENANERLIELSNTDPLTQIANRRFFDISFEGGWVHAMRNRVKISLILCDIDHFKNVNDTLGHQTGDLVLIHLSKILQQSVKRASDLVARYGGEEFIIMLYNTDLEDATRICRLIQKTLKENDIFKLNNIDHKAVTISFGVSTLSPTNTDERSDFIAFVDKALYKAKESGRDCIVAKEYPAFASGLNG